MIERIDAYCKIESDDEAISSVVDLVHHLDKMKISRAVIHPPDSCYSWYNEEGNDLTVRMAQRFPNRLIPAITVNPWRKDANEVLLKWTKNGGRIVSFDPGIQGFMLSTNKLDSLLNCLVRENLNLLIYVHTGNHSFAAPTQLLLLANRFPGLNFIMGHSGATDYGTDVVPVCQLCSNVYIESSFARPLKFMDKLNQLGFSRGIMGSGYPYNNLEFEWAEMKRLLPVEYHDDVLGGNLLKLLG